MFFGNFCPPCRMLKPILAGYQGDDYDVHFVDIEGNIKLASQEGIRSVPTVYVYSGGSKVGGWRGYIPKNKIDTILEKIKGN